MYYTPKQAQEKFGYSQKTFARWADQGLIECKKSPGGHRIYLMASVEKMAKIVKERKPKRNQPKNLHPTSKTNAQAFDRSIDKRSAVIGLKIGLSEAERIRNLAKAYGEPNVSSYLRKIIRKDLDAHRLEA